MQDKVQNLVNLISNSKIKFDKVSEFSPKKK